MATRTAASPSDPVPDASRNSDELRAVIICDEAMHHERARLARITFPEVRRLAAERGVMFTDIDLRRGVPRGPAIDSRLRRHWLAELRHRDAHAIVLVAADGEEPDAHLVRSVVEDSLRADPTLARRVVIYACSGMMQFPAADSSSRRGAAMRSLRAWAAELDVPLHDARPGKGSLVDCVRDDLAAVLAGFGMRDESGPLARERRAHEEFAASRRIGSSSRREAMSWLTQALRAGDRPIVIVGAPGSGRSTLVAQWVAAYRQHQPDAILLLHHVGVVNADETWRDVAAHIIRELHEHAGLVETGADPDSGNTFDRDELAFQLAHIAAIGATVVIDGVERLSEGASLDWLPSYLPPGLRLVITSTSLPEIARHGGWEVTHLTELTLTERRAFAEHFMALREGGASRGVHMQIASDTSITTPLALRLRLESFPTGMSVRSGDVTTMAATLDDLLNNLLVRLESEFATAAVRGLLTALWGARHGLWRHEALRAVPGLPELDLADLLTALDLHLISVDGRLRFHNDAFRRGVQSRYLGAEGAIASLHARLAALFEEMATGESEGLATDLQKGAGNEDGDEAGEDPDVADRGSRDHGVIDRSALRRWAEEAPWHLRLAGDMEGLRACLMRGEIIISFVEREREFELIALWNALGDIDALPAACHGAITLRRDAPAADRVELMVAAGTLMRHAAHYADALAVLRAAADLVEQTGSHQERFRGSVATRLSDLLYALGRFEEAEEWCRTGLDALRKLHGPNHLDVAGALGDLAELLLVTGRHLEAVKHYRSALRMAENIGAGTRHVATAANNLACALHDIGYHEEAEALFHRVLELWRAVGGGDHPNVAATMNNLAVLLDDKGETKAATELRGNVAAAWERMLGPDHPMVATALCNLATGIARNDPAGAIPLLDRALAIHTAVHAAPTPETALIHYAIGRAQFHARQLDEAEHHLRRAYDLQRTLLGAQTVATATTLAGLGMVVRERGDLLVAEQLLSSALEVLRSAVGERHLLVGTLLGNLAEVAARRNDVESARKLAHAALDILVAFEARGKVAELRSLLASLEDGTDSVS